jgi:integrase/recombinase XerC
MPPSVTPDAVRAEDRTLIERYLRVLEVERKLSMHTVTSYRRELLTLAALVRSPDAGSRAAADLTVVNNVQIRRYAAQLHGRGLSGRSIARALSAWRTFYHWLTLQDQCAANPVLDVRAPRSGKRLPKALPVEQAVALVAARGSSDDPDEQVAEARDAAIRELFYSSGLRLSELIGLDVAWTSGAAYRPAGWLDLAGAEVAVTGKGGKQRHVPVGQAALAALRVWLALRERWLRPELAEGARALFIGRRGARISASVIQTRLKAHARLLGIPANVHPHVLRHSFASHVLQSSGDLRAVQELLGHSSISSTQVYTSLDFQRLAAVYDTAHPRAKKP